jgi:hypothetical protein
MVRLAMQRAVQDQQEFQQKMQTMDLQRRMLLDAVSRPVESGVVREQLPGFTESAKVTSTAPGASLGIEDLPLSDRPFEQPGLEIARKADRGRTIRNKFYDGTTSERELLTRPEMAQQDIQDRIASIRAIGGVETQQKIAEGRQIREGLGFPSTPAVRAGTGLDKLLPAEAISLYGTQQASDRAMSVQQEIAQRASDAQVAQDQREANRQADLDKRAQQQQTFQSGENALNRENSLKAAGIRSRAATGGEQDIDDAARALASGDLTRLKDISSLRGSQRLQIFTRAKRLNPNFSTAEVDRQIKMEDNVTNGKDGQQIQSFATFLEHAGGASDAIQRLRLSSVPGLNKPMNWWRKNVSGSGDYQSMMAALEPARKEVESFLLNNRALYQDDRKVAERILSDDSSPAQLQAALKTWGHVAQARFNEINYRYSRVRKKNIDDPFSDEAIEGARKIGVDLAVKSKLAKTPGAGGPPPPSAGKIAVTAPNGKTYYFSDQVSADNFKKAAGL